ncbi:MAG TPA: M28 family peptidase [Alphaproteobacteria bacterium]|nr:M28 family peptidase [Alphaproteobacteria bacterium]
MRRIVVAVLLGCLAPWAAQAAGSAPAEVAAQLGRAGLNDPTASAFLESLTTEIGPRLAGTDAMTRAAAWAEAKLKTLGFENVHREAFPMKAWIRGTESARVLSPAPQNLAVTALGGSLATPADGIEAEIALFRTYADLLAAPAGSLADKIAVVTQRMVRSQDGGGYGAMNPVRRAGPSEAAKRGAVAYLLRSLGTDDHRLPHTGALNYADGVAKIPAAALSTPDADQLERLAARGPVRIRLVLSPTERDAQSWNIVGEVKGRERPDDIVLIGAHLDSWDLGTGATDDGAGDAIVTGAAHLIAQLPQHPRRTIRVVLFGAEEMEFSGAAYAKAHEAEVSKIALAGESDAGARGVFAVQVPAVVHDGEFGRTLADVLAPLGAYLDRLPAQFSGSDTMGLQKLGVPVASLRQNMSDYFDTHHTADDTLDKIDSKQLNQAVAVWAAFVYLAAETGTDFRPATAAAK